MSTPETDKILAGAFDILTLSNHAKKLETERDELRAKLQYVTGQLIDAGCDDGAAPVEELARRAKNDIAGLRAEVETLKADNARKLALCRDALGEISTFRTMKTCGDGKVISEDAKDIAIEALAATEPKP